MKTRLLYVIAIAIIMASCGTQKQTQKQPKEQTQIATNLAPEKAPVEVWSFGFSSAKTAPVIQNGIAYTISSGRTIYAIDIKTHQQKWAYSISFGEIIKQKCVIDNDVVLVTCDNIVYGIDIETGEYIWTKTGGEYDGIYSVSPVAAARGLMFYWKPNKQMQGDKFCAADIKTGELKWEIELRSEDWHRPAINDSVIIIKRTFVDWINQHEKGEFNYLAAFDILTGEELWTKVYSEYVEEAPIVRAPIINKHNIFIQVDEHLECLDMKGNKKWSFEFDNTSFKETNSVIKNGKIFVESGKTYVLNIEDGSLLWKTDAVPYKQRQYAISENMLLIQTDETTIKAFDMNNGTEKWMFTDPSAKKIFLGSEIVDKTIFVNYDGQKMALLGEKDSFSQKNDETNKIIIPPPVGVEVMNTTTKVFASLNLPKNDNWVIKNEDATWRADEFLVKKMDEYKTVSVIRTMTFHDGNSDLNDTTAILKSINANAGMLLGYNDYHFKKDGNGDPIETPVYTTKITHLSNNVKVVLMEAEFKITNTNYKTYGNSYYARNYFILANREDGKKCIPVVFSATELTPDNYAVEKQKFIELVDYVANTAVLKPEYKFEN